MMKTIAKMPDFILPPYECLKQARDQLAAGDFDAAAGLLYGAQKAFPDNVYIHMELGKVERVRENHVESNTAFRTAFHLAVPADEEENERRSQNNFCLQGMMNFEWGKNFRQWGRYVEAYACFKLAAAMDPRDVERQLEYAGIFIDLDELAEAENRLARLEREYRNNASVTRVIARCSRAKGKYDESATLLQRALKYDLYDARTQADLGITRLMQGRPKDAKLIFEASLKLRPGNYTAKKGLEILKKMGNDRRKFAAARAQILKLHL